MTQFDPLELVDPKGQHVCVRNGVTIAFFLERHTFQCSSELIAALDLVLETCPEGSFRKAVVSATSEEWKDLTPATLKKMRDSLAPEGARKRKLTGFRLNDHGSEAPQYGFRVLDRDKDPEYADSRTLVQITLPIDWLRADRVSALVSLVERLAGLLQPEYGYCSPSLLTSDAGQPSAFAQLKGLAARYPGYDVDMNMMTSLSIGSRVRGARWLTVLGQALWSRVVGQVGSTDRLPDGLNMTQIGEVRLLRAGLVPEIGDMNRNAKTPHLHSLAKVLESITVFGEVDLLSYFAGFDEDYLRTWERRFLDQRL